MNRRALFCALLVLPLAACGSSASTSTQQPPATTTTITKPQQMTITVFHSDGVTVSPEAVQVPKTEATAAASLKALGIDATVTISDGTATVDLAQPTPAQIQEIVYTLTQYPSVQSVVIGGKTYTRADLDPHLQPIFVETPAAHAHVPPSFDVSGSASVFEATLVVELKQGGKVVLKTVTASEGAPNRGTFDTVVHAPAAGDATVVVFAPSAEDGSPQHEIDVPVTVSP
jgi:hypothetical protein